MRTHRESLYIAVGAVISSSRSRGRALSLFLHCFPYKCRRNRALQQTRFDVFAWSGNGFLHRTRSQTPSGFLQIFFRPETGGERAVLCPLLLPENMKARKLLGGTRSFSLPFLPSFSTRRAQPPSSGVAAPSFLHTCSTRVGRFRCRSAHASDSVCAVNERRKEKQARVMIVSTIINK